MKKIKIKLGIDREFEMVRKELEYRNREKKMTARKFPRLQKLNSLLLISNVSDPQINRTKCTLHTSSNSYCQLFCFSFITGLMSVSPADIPMICSDEGWEVIKVDRYLKQCCMEQAIGNYYVFLDLY